MVAPSETVTIRLRLTDTPFASTVDPLSGERLGATDKRNVSGKAIGY